MLDGTMAERVPQQEGNEDGLSKGSMAESSTRGTSSMSACQSLPMDTDDPAVAFEES